MSFGQGPHFCLGNYLSRMEARAALEVAFSRFDVLEPVSDIVAWLDSYFARGPHSLPVRFRPRAYITTTGAYRLSTKGHRRPWTEYVAALKLWVFLATGESSDRHGKQ